MITPEQLRKYQLESLSSEAQALLSAKIEIIVMNKLATKLLGVITPDELQRLQSLPESERVEAIRQLALTHGLDAQVQQETEAALERIVRR